MRLIVALTAALTVLFLVLRMTRSPWNLVAAS
jgi:hypothetical protein